MIKVNVHFMGYLSDFTGTKEAVIELPDKSTFKDLLTNLKEGYVKKIPEPLYKDGEFKMIMLMLNLRDIFENKDGERPLADGDTLHLIPPIGGG